LITRPRKAFLRVDYGQVRSAVADTSAVGFTNPTGGSRATFATGMALVEASKKIVDELRGRAAMIWDDGHAGPTSSKVGNFPPRSLKEIAPKRR
jgi:CO/xanthine dehydrogenase Mo-binding subunit